jgi:RNA polymerase sigma factor (TIGR02999 family)
MGSDCKQGAGEASPDPAAMRLDALNERLYPELIRLARAQLRRLRPGMTLDTTALVHEVYLKFQRDMEFLDRAHFLAASARAMRHILVNAARDRMAAKRGGGSVAVSLDPAAGLGDSPAALEVLQIGLALEGLAMIDARLCEVVECRFFAGMTEAETAEAMQVSERTVRRHWLRARAWLRDALDAASAGV